MSDPSSHNPNPANRPATAPTASRVGASSSQLASSDLRRASSGVASSALTNPRPAILQSSPNPIDLLKALRRRWLLASVLAVVLAVPAATVAWMTVPVTYTTSSWLRVGGTKLLYSVNKTAMSMKTHAQMIRSYFVLNGALSQPQVADLPWVQEQERKGRDAADWLSDKISVHVPRDDPEASQIMQIGMSGDDPEQIQVLVQAVTDAYLERVVNEEKKDLLKRRDQLEQTYHRKAEEIRKKRESLRVLAKQIGTADSDAAAAQQQLLMDHVLYLRRQAGAMRQQWRDRARALRLFVQRTDWDKTHGAPSPEVLEGMVASDPQLEKYDRELAGCEQRLRRFTRIVRDPEKSSHVALLRQQCEELESARKARYDAVRNRLDDQVRNGTLRTEVQHEHHALATEVAELKREHESLEEQYVLISEDVQKLGIYAVDLERRRDDLDHLVEITKAVGMELEKLQLELSAGAGDRIQLIQKARMPRSADDARRNKLTVMAALLGVAIALGGTSLFEFHHRRLSTSDEMTRGLGVKVLGSVPMLSDRPSSWRRALSGERGDLQSVMDESIEGVRAMLLHAPENESVRTILVTSPASGEGKTTVAGSLAASIGRTGRRTLLIDGDLRRPSAHRLLDMPMEAGLSDVLRGDVAAEEVIRPSHASGLSFLSAGNCDYAALQSLTQDVVAKTIEQLRTQFDFIVIDSGPVLSVADPLLLGQHCDGAIVSVVRSASQIPAVHETCERLRSTGIRILGCVVNGLDGNPFKPTYYGYGYGIENA